MIIGRPGLTFWMQSWGTRDSTPAQVRATMERELPPGAYDVVREDLGDGWRTTMRIAANHPDGRRPALSTLIWGRGHLLSVTAYFDDEADAATALAIVRSIRPRS